jgi:hypothetical protein
VSDLHWSVTVELNGEPVLTIAHNHLCGAPEIPIEAIRIAAHHLLAFIGDVPVPATPNVE